MKVLSIDAWREPEGGWTWNNWHHVGDVTKEEFEACNDDPRKLLKLIRGVVGNVGAGEVRIEDDQHNIVMVHRHSGEPMYAIEYGPEY